MFFLGFIIGAMVFGSGLFVGFWFFRSRSHPASQTQQAFSKPTLLNRKSVRKTPKSVSEFEQWKKEQGQPPGDPI